MIGGLRGVEASSDYIEVRVLSVLWKSLWVGDEE